VKVGKAVFIPPKGERRHIAVSNLTPGHSEKIIDNQSSVEYIY
jgi:hypothetical protein